MDHEIEHSMRKIRTKEGASAKDYIVLAKYFGFFPALRRMEFDWGNLIVPDRDVVIDNLYISTSFWRGNAPLYRLNTGKLFSFMIEGTFYFYFDDCAFFEGKNRYINRKRVMQYITQDQWVRKIWYFAIHQSEGGIMDCFKHLAFGLSPDNPEMRKLL